MVTKSTTEGAPIKYCNAGIVNGEIVGTTAATQLATVDCELVNIKAQNENLGNVYIGGSTVTAHLGTTNTTCGFQLNAGEETGWIPITNLNLLYNICDGLTDHSSYIAVL